mmetsp:Transcript_1106/g.3079  ORF Transcript_1106/g.3079 Transcript_1106/m.3079 type:complete len:183 (-) Transcript_1106:1018-1566(-)
MLRTVMLTTVIQQALSSLSLYIILRCRSRDLALVLLLGHILFTMTPSLLYGLSPLVETLPPPFQCRRLLQRPLLPRHHPSRLAHALPLSHRWEFPSIVLQMTSPPLLSMLSLSHAGARSLRFERKHLHLPKSFSSISGRSDGEDNSADYVHWPTLHEDGGILILIFDATHDIHILLKSAWLL